MSDTPTPTIAPTSVPPKAKAGQAKPDLSVFPSIRMLKDVEGSDMPVAVFVREDQVAAFTKDGFKRDEA